MVEITSPTELFQSLLAFPWSSRESLGPEVEPAAREHVRRVRLVIEELVAERNVEPIQGYHEVLVPGCGLHDEQALRASLHPFSELLGDWWRKYAEHVIVAYSCWSRHPDLSELENPWEPLLDLYKAGYTASYTEDDAKRTLDLVVAAKTESCAYRVVDEAWSDRFLLDKYFEVDDAGARRMLEYAKSFNAITWRSPETVTPEAEALIQEHLRRIRWVVQHQVERSGLAPDVAYDRALSGGEEHPDYEGLSRLLHDLGGFLGGGVISHLELVAASAWLWASDPELGHLENPWEPLIALYRLGYTTSFDEREDGGLDLTVGVRENIVRYPLVDSSLSKAS